MCRCSITLKSSHLRNRPLRIRGKNFKAPVGGHFPGHAFKRDPVIEDRSGFCFSIGSLFVLLACVCWGFENNCTRMLSDKNPLEIVRDQGPWLRDGRAAHRSGDRRSGSCCRLCAPCASARLCRLWDEHLLLCLRATGAWRGENQQLTTRFRPLSARQSPFCCSGSPDFDVCDRFARDDRRDLLCFNG